MYSFLRLMRNAITLAAISFSFFVGFLVSFVLFKKGFNDFILVFSFLLGFSVGGIFFYSLAVNKRFSIRGKRGRYYALRKRLTEGPFIVCIGGGTGLSTLLKGIKAYTSNITAIVTVTDEGGSSGILRQEWGVLPPGDIRNCLVALADDEGAVSSLFQYRFTKGVLKGHSLGNLILLALTEMKGDFKKAVEYLSRLLATRGVVIPVTMENIIIAAETEDGNILEGELNVAKSGGRIKKVYLKPKDPKPTPGIREAIRSANIIVLGPGSLFTSVIPNLLVKDIQNWLFNVASPIIYVCNIMTQPGETDGFTVYDHVKWIAKVLGRYPDWVFVHEGTLPKEILDKYYADGAEVVKLSPNDLEKIKAMGCKVRKGAFATVVDGVIRHDPFKLAEAIMDVWKGERGW